MVKQRITPFLWFDNQAEEAAHFYVSMFKNSKINGVACYDDESARASGRPKGSVHRGPLARRALRDAGRGRPLLGQAHGGRGRNPVRLAQGSNQHRRTGASVRGAGRLESIP